MNVQWILVALLITSLGCGGTDTTPAPDAGEPPQDTTQPMPDTTQPTPDTTQPMPDTTQPTPDTTQPTPDTSPPAPDVPACTPDCAGKQCGPDGCGATCGTCPDNGSNCDAQGQCVMPTPPPPPPAGGACTNAADQAIIDSKDLNAIAKDCGIAQFVGGPPAAQCIKDQTGLSDACIVCFEGTVDCGVQCAGECLFAPDSPACDQCLEDKGCLAEFATCSGIPTTDE